MEHADDVLSRAPLFEALDEESAKALRALITEVDLVRGQRLFDEGDAGDRVIQACEGGRDFPAGGEVPELDGIASFHAHGVGYGFGGSFRWLNGRCAYRQDVLTVAQLVLPDP